MDVLTRLLAWADVIVYDASGGSWAASIERCRGTGQIVVELSASGSVPFAASVPASLAFEAVGGSGVELRARTEDERPLPAPAGVAEVDTAVMAASAVLAGLVGRQLGNAPADERLTATVATTSVMASLERQDLAAFVNEGIRHDRPEGYGPFLGLVLECRDGYVITHLGDPQWPSWCKAIGDPDLALDERYANREERGRHSRALVERLERWTRKLTRADVEEALQPLGVPVGAVQRPREVLTDPQVQHRGFITAPATDIRTCAALPYLVNGARWTAGGEAPRHGQHTAAICAELGYSDSETSGLLQSGTLW
jgi:crotonobetainyl-CoA:carnitine CoA-transferase CaiB-like acyl-CoA transferase